MNEFVPKCINLKGTCHEHYRSILTLSELTGANYTFINSTLSHIIFHFRGSPDGRQLLFWLIDSCSDLSESRIGHRTSPLSELSNPRKCVGLLLMKAGESLTPESFLAKAITSKLLLIMENVFAFFFPPNLCDFN